ncbi:FAD-dependent oxidoreductase [Capillimicrobium parvum]|uniref:FAD-dependent oxidoreductase n=1 Tax=Capillimicrobium parvum TaxID=2884022 RepID=UPI0038990639
MDRPIRGGQRGDRQPWWREDGLAGVASGLASIPLVLDLSPTEGDEGILCALFFGSGPALARYGGDPSSDEATRALTLEALETYFEPKARAPKEFYVRNWEDDPWSRGCGSQVPTCTLSSVGATLRRPIGRIVFAGAETGTTDFMEGAVTSGQRAARRRTRAARRP